MGTRLGACATCALLAAFLCGCVSTADEGLQARKSIARDTQPDPFVDGQTATPTLEPTEVPTLSVPGSPDARVTDVQSVGLSGVDIEKLKNSCKGSLGIPGTLDNCSGIPARRPPCTPKNDFCLHFAKIVGTDMSVIAVTDQRPGQPLCKSRIVAICGPTVVNADVTRRLRSGLGEGASPTLTKGNRPLPSTPKPTTTPTATPTTTSSPTPTATSSTESKTVRPSVGPTTQPLATLLR